MILAARVMGDIRENVFPVQTEMHNMPRVRIALLTGLALLITLSSVEAGWHEFWHRVHTDFHRNNCWPEPFSTVDRRATRAPFEAMVRNGWRLQNTLGAAYFHHETNVLNDAGKRKLYWILANSPEQFKTVYVYQSYDPEISEKRLNSVQQTLAQLLPNQAMPSVLPSLAEPVGASADYVDQVDRKMRSTIPNPRLPTFQAAGGFGGG